MPYPIRRSESAPSTPRYYRIDGDAEKASLRCRRHPRWTDAPVKRCAILLFYILLGVLISGFIVKPFFFRSVTQLDKILYRPGGAPEDYLAHFEGHQDCGFLSPQLYSPPYHTADNDGKSISPCSNRASLLEAMSGGGRHGFEEPFTPKGCRYRWYTTEEICMILDRFDGVVFIGDDMLRHIYAAFNILLRENVALGGLEQWKMTDIERDSCRCDHQFVKPECSNFLVSSSEEVTKHGSEGAHRSPFYCQRTPHFFLQIRGSPAPETLHTTLADLLAKDHDSYKPVPMIHSIGLSTALEWLSATKSMDEWLAIADKSLRNTPFLWVGPAAAGHLKPPAQIMGQGNNALWHYTIQTAKEAGSRGLEVLGMYNMTLQAASWDGSHYGEKVALVQAMTIINWLSRLESS